MGIRFAVGELDKVTIISFDPFAPVLRICPRH